MKYESECDALTANEVAHQLLSSVLDSNERIGESYVEDGVLYVNIHYNEPSHPRLDGTLLRTDEFTLSDLRRELCEGEVYCWAKDENGTDVLLCNN